MDSEDVSVLDRAAGGDGLGVVGEGGLQGAEVVDVVLVVVVRVEPRGVLDLSLVRLVQVHGALLGLALPPALRVCGGALGLAGDGGAQVVVHDVVVEPEGLEAGDRVRADDDVHVRQRVLAPPREVEPGQLLLDLRAAAVRRHPEHLVALVRHGLIVARRHRRGGGGGGDGRRQEGGHEGDLHDGRAWGERRRVGGGKGRDKVGAAEGLAIGTGPEGEETLL